MIPDEIIIRQREDGTWEEHKPYMTVEFETEEDFKYFEKVLEDHKRMQWIPCSERLPGNIKTVLITIKELEQPILGWYGDKFGWRIITSEFVNIKDFTVIAWMPLPEPYELKGE